MTPHYLEMRPCNGTACPASLSRVERKYLRQFAEISVGCEISSLRLEISQPTEEQAVCSGHKSDYAFVKYFGVLMRPQNISQTCTKR